MEEADFVHLVIHKHSVPSKRTHLTKVLYKQILVLLVFPYRFHMLWSLEVFCFPRTRTGVNDFFYGDACVVVLMDTILVLAASIMRLLCS